MSVRGGGGCRAEIWYVGGEKIVKNCDIHRSGRIITHRPHQSHGTLANALARAQHGGLLVQALARPGDEGRRDHQGSRVDGLLDEWWLKSKSRRMSVS